MPTTAALTGAQPNAVSGHGLRSKKRTRLGEARPHSRTAIRPGCYIRGVPSRRAAADAADANDTDGPARVRHRPRPRRVL